MTRDKNDFPAVRTSATDGQFGKAVDPESKTGNLRKVNQSIAEALRLISKGIQHLKRVCLPKTSSGMTRGWSYGNEAADGRVSDPAAVCFPLAAYAASTA
jgi:hypothetical protein